MQKDITKKEYLDLVQEINKHNYLYYNANQPLLSDSDYDALFQRLVEIEKNHPEWVTPSSPSMRVGAPLDEENTAFNAVVHQIPMLSLQNGYHSGDIDSFDQRVRSALKKKEIIYAAEMKYDGIAVSLRYDNGKMILGATRGDGQQGEDITANLKTIHNLPVEIRSESLKIPRLLEVRGEVFISHAAFQRINKEREQKKESLFANPRNAAAGAIKLLNPAQAAKRGLEVVLYQIAQWEQENFPQDQESLWHSLELLGLPVPQQRVIGTLNKIKDFYEYWQRERATLPFDVDGIVIKVNDFSLRESLGHTARSPRWAIAWKFAARSGISKLEAVRFQVSRMGVLTPVAELKPISIGGVWVRRSTLHNLREMKRLGVRIGDYVEIIRAGDVIPKVVKVFHEKRVENETQEIVIPDHCPECGGQTEIDAEQTFLYCTNSHCIGVIREKLRFFVSKDGIDLAGIGEELIVKMYEQDIIKDAADLFYLTAGKLAGLDRMGEKSIQNILSTVNRKKNLPLVMLLRGLGINGVGENIAYLLADYFKNWESFSQATEMDLMELDGIGPILAANIVKFLAKKENQEFIQRLMNAGVKFLPVNESKTLTPSLFLNDDDEEVVLKQIDFFNGKKVVVTGTLEKWSRKEIEQIIRNLGGKILSDVSEKCDYLIVGEKPGSKISKARKLNVSVITEIELVDLLT